MRWREVRCDCPGGSVEYWSDAQTTPDGYPATPETTPGWCLYGDEVYRDERCGTDLDEDCDGAVDEYPGLGEPCATDCQTFGIMVCNPETLEAVCQNVERPCEVPVTCGNGYLELSIEPCDLSAAENTLPNKDEAELLAPYCTKDCRVDTNFRAKCWDSTGTKEDEIVYRGQYRGICVFNGLVCSEHVKTCVPTVSGGGRCPRLARPETAERYAERVDAGVEEAPVYNMVESENGECWITCQGDEDCPQESMRFCYMGTCVVW